LFLTGLLSTVISTVDSYSFLAAIALGRDLIWRNFGKGDEKKIQPLVRIGLWISAALAVGLALISQSVVGLWHDLGTIGAPALVVPMLATFSQKHRLQKRWATIGIVGAGTTSLIWLMIGKVNGGAYPLGLEPIIPGLLASLLCYFLGRTTAR